MKVALLGDIAFFGKFCLSKNPDVFNVFSDVRSYLSKFDFVVANLEAPFVTKRDKPIGHKSAYIGSDAINVELLKFIGVNIVNLSNNHIYDYGEKGLENTIKILDENNIKWFGVKGRSLLIDNDEKVALHGYCAYNTNSLGLKKDKAVSPLHVKDIENALKKNHKAGFYNIVSIHSGDEQVNYPSIEDIALARHLACICPFTFYGHHPHVAQGIEFYKNSLIAYSLGNFCFDDVSDPNGNLLVKQSVNNKSSLILEIEVIGGELTHYDFTSIYNNNDRINVCAKFENKKIDEYSSALHLDSVEYLNMRKSFLSKAICSRNSNRSLKWFINRVKLSTLIRLLMVMKNKNLQKKHVTKYLSI